MDLRNGKGRASLARPLPVDPMTTRQSTPCDGDVPFGRLGGLPVEPGRVELDPALLPHGDVAGQGDHGVGQGDLAAAAGLVVLVGVVVGGVAVADAVGEVLELLAVAARRVGRRQAAERRRRPTGRRCSG